MIALYRDHLQGWEADSQAEAINSEAKSLSSFFEKGERKLSVFSNETAGDKNLVSLTYVDAGGS